MAVISLILGVVAALLAVAFAFVLEESAEYRTDLRPGESPLHDWSWDWRGKALLRRYYRPEGKRFHVALVILFALGTADILALVAVLLST